MVWSLTYFPDDIGGLYNVIKRRIDYETTNQLKEGDARAREVPPYHGERSLMLCHWSTSKGYHENIEKVFYSADDNVEHSPRNETPARCIGYYSVDDTLTDSFASLPEWAAHLMLQRENQQSSVQFVFILAPDLIYSRWVEFRQSFLSAMSILGSDCRCDVFTASLLISLPTTAIQRAYDHRDHASSSQTLYGQGQSQDEARTDRKGPMRTVDNSELDHGSLVSFGSLLLEGLESKKHEVLGDLSSSANHQWMAYTLSDTKHRITSIAGGLIPLEAIANEVAVIPYTVPTPTTMHIHPGDITTPLFDGDEVENKDIENVQPIDITTVSKVI